ncbi:MAG TPA: OmpA family protein [Polyangia bacterium]|nr:OmpA family protein [Polyangia bacterium]
MTPALALAQPADDPGMGEPAPRPPAVAPPVAAPPPPPPRALPPPPPPPPIVPEVQEHTDEKITFVDEPAASGAPAQSGDLYDRVAAPSLYGPVGLFRTLTGDSGAQGHFRIGLHVGGFQQDDFLVASNGSAKGDTNGHFNGDLTIGYTPWKYLEAYLGIFNSSNHNTRNDAGRTDPAVILALGDFAFGLKGRYPVTRFLDVALHLGVRFTTAVNGLSLDGDSTNFAADAIASLDLRHFAATKKVPLRFHFNLGYYLDNSIKLLPAGQCSTSTGNDPCIRSRVVETFAYGIGSSRFRISLAADAPVAFTAWGIQPFVEYHVDASLGDGDQVLLKALKGSVAGDRLTGNIQQFVTLGLRARPVAGLILDAGIDVGAESPGFQYGPPVPQWNLTFGAAYAYDPVGQAKPKTKVVTKTITREISRGPVTGKVRGIVRDAATKKPLGGATVRYLNRRENPQLSADDGTFTSYGFSPGLVVVEVSRDDYNSMRVETTASADRETPIEALLTAKPPQNGTLRGKITDDAGLPVAAAVRLTPAAGGNAVDADLEAPGVFSARLPGGDYSMEVTAPNHLAKQRTITISAGQLQTVEIVLHKKPATSHVALTKNEIAIKGTIHFGTNNAEIKPDGEQLLDEVVDVMVKNPQLRKIRVEGHTDNRGDAELNLALSKARAAAVVQYLVKQGVDPARLQSEGYGATQPLVPNLTPANRAKNRRVTFRILDGGAP